jgi:hypothetical protein
MRMVLKRPTRMACLPAANGISEDIRKRAGNKAEKERSFEF